MRLVAKSQVSFERIVGGIIDIQVYEIQPFAVLCFEPMHDGRQTTAGRSPEREELHQLGLTGGQLHLLRVSRFQPGFHLPGGNRPVVTGTRISGNCRGSFRGLGIWRQVLALLGLLEWLGRARWSRGGWFALFGSGTARR